jgi:hypothetical protein
MEVIFSNIHGPNTTRRAQAPVRRDPVQTYVPHQPAATGDNYQGGIRYFAKCLNRYVELHEVWSLDQIELNKLWTECRLVSDSFSPHLKPARKATAELFTAMCKYTSRKWI